MEDRAHSFNVEYKVGGRQVKEERVIRLYPGNFAEEKATTEFTVISRLFVARAYVKPLFNFFFFLHFGARVVVEGCDAGGGLHGHPLHPVWFEECKYLLIGHFILGQFLSVWSHDGGLGVFLVDTRSRNNCAHRMA
jgi:hypothetical protein